jgi:hypothetical protein
MAALDVKARLPRRFHLPRRLRWPTKVRHQRLGVTGAVSIGGAAARLALAFCRATAIALGLEIILL